MYYSIFPDKDTTIYEHSQSLNTGLDEILEIKKDISPDGSAVNVSRILIKFDVSEISSSIVSGKISSNAKYYLNLYDAGSTGLSTSDLLYVYPVSQSWTMGSGKFDIYPIIEEGVSWRYRTGKTTGDTWISGSLNTGGAWYSGSGYEVSQSLDFTTTDIRVDVTPIVSKWLSSTIPNDGFMIKRSGSIGNTDTNTDEGNTTDLGTLKFFSRETHTVYPPRLEVEWDDSNWSTGSLSGLNSSELETLRIYMKNLKPEYNQNSKVKFRLVGRSQYPTKTWASTPSQLTVKYLPSGSTTSLDGTYYSIKDAFTEDVIIPYGTGSIVSCDSSGNYFTLWMNTFQPERFYRIEYKIVSGSGTTNEIKQYIDNDFIFKVVR